MQETDPIIAWILAEGLNGDLAGLVAGVAMRLAGTGCPIERMQLSMPSLDPEHRAITVTWYADGRLLLENNEHDESPTQEFLSSPVHHLLTEGLTEGRWNLRDAGSLAPFPLLETLAADGWTDYVLHLVGFPRETFILGMACSVTTRRAAGFEAGDLGIVEAILPALGLAAYRMALTRMAADVLGLYVGPRTSGRILGGKIRRGDGNAIYAAILLADMRNFTSLNERHPPRDIVGWLNEHFEAIGAAVESEGGEILKLIGDGLLAIFPVEDETGALACRRALAAARHAIEKTRGVNERRRGIGAPEMEVDVVLHLGEVFYGNVGAARRLDFTVIGRVVNEAARLETLCRELRRPLLLSESFAERCGTATECLGRFKLKGVSEPQAVFATTGEPAVRA